MFVQANKLQQHIFSAHGQEDKIDQNLCIHISYHFGKSYTYLSDNPLYSATLVPEIPPLEPNYFPSKSFLNLCEIDRLTLIF